MMKTHAYMNDSNYKIGTGIIWQQRLSTISVPTSHWNFFTCPAVKSWITWQDKGASASETEWSFYKQVFNFAHPKKLFFRTRSGLYQHRPPKLYCLSIYKLTEIKLPPHPAFLFYLDSPLDTQISTTSDLGTDEITYKRIRYERERERGGQADRQTNRLECPQCPWAYTQ